MARPVHHHIAGRTLEPVPQGFAHAGRHAPICRIAVIAALMRLDAIGPFGGRNDIEPGDPGAILDAGADAQFGAVGALDQPLLHPRAQHHAMPAHGELLPWPRFIAAAGPVVRQQQAGRNIAGKHALRAGPQQGLILPARRLAKAGGQRDRNRGLRIKQEAARHAGPELGLRFFGPRARRLQNAGCGGKAERKYGECAIHRMILARPTEITSQQNGPSAA